MPLLQTLWQEVTRLVSPGGRDVGTYVASWTSGGGAGPILVALAVLAFGKVAHSLYTNLVLPAHLRHLPALSPLDTVRVLAKRQGFLQANSALRKLRAEKAIKAGIAKGSDDPVLSRGVAWLFGHWVVEVSDPVDVKRILSDIETFPKMMLNEVNMHLNYMFFGENVAFSNGEGWKHHRRVVGPAFKRGWPTYFFGRPTCALIRELDKIAAQPKGIMDPTEWMHRLALDALAPLAFGESLNAVRDANAPLNQLYARVIHEAMDPANAMLPWWLYWCFPRYHRILADMNEFNAYILKVIDSKLDAVRERQKQNEAAKSKAGKNIAGRALDVSMSSWTPTAANSELGHSENDDRDLLDIMAEAALHSETFTREELRTDTIIFLLAGHDTSGNTLSFALYLLGMHPEIQSRARAEVLDTMLGGGDLAKNTPWDQVPWPTNEQQAQMRYLTRVLKETLRIYPPVNALPHRKTTKQVTLADGRTRLPKGAILSIDVIAAHRAAAHWGSGVMTFDPDRWSPAEDHVLQPTGEHGYSWTPFGGGPRICLGQQFAITEMRTMLAMLLLRYEWTTVGDADALAGNPNTYPGILLHSCGIEVELRRRDVDPKQTAA